jgi:hypothetical protein
MEAPRTVRISLLCHYGASSGPLLLEHFLDHYWNLGVDRFFVILHRSESGEHTRQILDTLARRGLEPAALVNTFSIKLKLERYREVVALRCTPEDWVLYADGDELQVYPSPIHQFASSLQARGIGYATGRFVDRLAPAGELAAIRPSPSLWEQFPYAAPVTERITGGWAQKVCLARAGLRLAEGGAHALALGRGVMADYQQTHAEARVPPVDIHHFKWDHSLRVRLANKLNVRAGDRDAVDGVSFIAEYHRLAAHLSQHAGIYVENPKWAGVPRLHYERDVARDAHDPPR